MHHALHEFPNGNLLTLSMEVRNIGDYPASEVDEALGTTPRDVAGDVVIELDRHGNVASSWPMFDLLDPTRVGRDAVNGTWWAEYLGADVRDWSHGNALHYDPATDAITVALRHQDAIVQSSRESGVLNWILAHADDAADFDVVDVPATTFDAQISDPEFDGVHSRVTWQTASGTAVWVADIDAATGLFVPAHGRGQLVDTDVAPIALQINGPEWVQTASRAEILYPKFVDDRAITSEPSRRPSTSAASRAKASRCTWHSVGSSDTANAASRGLDWRITPTSNASYSVSPGGH